MIIKNKTAFVAIIHKSHVTFPCGIIYDIDDIHRRKLIEHILYNTGIKFNSLMSADLKSDLNPIVYADGSNEIYLSLCRTTNLQ